jgi:hypothetical protein
VLFDYAIAYSTKTAIEFAAYPCGLSPLVHPLKAL